MNVVHPKSFALFLEQTDQSNRLRWFFGVGVGCLFWLVYNHTAYQGIIGVLFLIFLIATIGYSFIRGRIQKSNDEPKNRFKWLKLIAFGQAAFDLVLLTIAIHLSGGGISPLALLYIIYIGSTSVFFPVNLLIVLNILSAILYFGLMQLYVAHLATPVIPPILQNIQITDNFETLAIYVYSITMAINGFVIYLFARQVQAGWRNADLQARYLEQLHHLAKLGLEYHQTDSLYQILADSICELIGADGIYLTCWDDELGQVVIGATSSELSQLSLSPSPTSGHQISMTQSVKRAGRPLAAENVYCSPYVSAKLVMGYPSHSLLGIPLYGLPDKHFLGALMVSYNFSHYYSPEEIERAQQAADVAALLISRTRLYEETLHRADLLQQLANQVTNITSDLRQTTLLPAIVEAASNLLHAPRAALHLYDQANKEMRCEFSIGLSEDYIKQITKRFNQIPDAQVLKNKPFVLIPDVYQDSRTSPIQDLIAYEKFRAYAVFALPSPEGSLGALSLYWDEPRAISSEEISVAELFAARAGTVLHNARLYEQASEESLTDPLTSLPNRRALDRRLSEENRLSGHPSRPYALLMIDLDGFKRINDTYGHPIGDSVLQQVTAALRRAVRSTDFISRYGGDEFAVILPESGIEKATFVADKLKSTLATTRLHLPNDAECFITASIGLAVCPNDTSEHAKLLAIADKRLYIAKRAGSGKIISQN